MSQTQQLSISLSLSLSLSLSPTTYQSRLTPRLTLVYFIHLTPPQSTLPYLTSSSFISPHFIPTLPTHLPTYLPTHSPTSLTYLPTYLQTYISSSKNISQQLTTFPSTILLFYTILRYLRRYISPPPKNTKTNPQNNNHAEFEHDNTNDHRYVFSLHLYRGIYKDPKRGEFITKW